MRDLRRRLVIACGGAAALLLAPPAAAFPEFQTALQKHSERVVSCALCHTHADGPDGMKHGQIGSLSPAELEALAAARAAVAPGSRVDNPILNEFGDSILSQVGREKVAACRAEPLTLFAALDQVQDLDGDRIPDAREALEGTHPVDPRHGNPALLFFHNLQTRWFDLLMLVGATLFGLYGLNHLFRWFAWEAEGALRGHPSPDEDDQ